MRSLMLRLLFVPIAALAASCSGDINNLPTTPDPKDEYTRFGDLVKKHFSGQVLIAKDLMEF